jgi:hypothetical protein
LLGQAGVEVHAIHNERNPLFGGSLPEPNEKNLTELSGLVVENGANLGLSLDGDADRFGMVDATGKYITSNQVIALVLLHWVRTRFSQGSVVRSVATSGMIDAIANRFGLKVIETPVGFKWVGNALNTTDAIVGGEESGGLSVKGHIPEKDGIVADLIVTEQVAKTGKTPLETLAEIREMVGDFITTRVDVKLTEASKQALMARLRDDTPATVGGENVASVSKVDGVKMVRDDGSWLLIRPSGTEPLVRCYIEARSDDGVAALNKPSTTSSPTASPPTIDSVTIRKRSKVPQKPSFTPAEIRRTNKGLIPFLVAGLAFGIYDLGRGAYAKQRGKLVHNCAVHIQRRVLVLVAPHHRRALGNWRRHEARTWLKEEQGVQAHQNQSGKAG